MSVSKRKSKKIDISTISGFVVGLLGVLATIFATLRTENKDFGIAFMILLGSEIIIVVLWGIGIYCFFNQEKKEEELQNKISEQDEQCLSIRKEVDDELKRLNDEHIKYSKYLSIISYSIKSNSIHNNELLVKIPSEGDLSYQKSELIIESKKLTDEQKREKLIQDANDYSNELFQIYKKYCSDMLGEIVKLETAYLKMKGYDLKVAASIKLFNRAYLDKRDRRTDIIVYTAFRDKESYDDRNDRGLPKREIGKKRYSIDGNADFSDCISKESYFINNATRDTNNYRNEHEDFDTYYNCTVVVPIRTKLDGAQKKHLGYLCCDCLNQEYTNAEIFDNVAAQFLFVFAQNLSTFLETLDTNWLDRFKDDAIEGIPKSVIDMIYMETCKDEF